MEKLIGSPKFKMALSDLEHMLNVALWVGGSAAATKLLEVLSAHDFGAYQIVAMSVINVLAVMVKKFFTDTQEVVEVETSKSDTGV